MTATDPLALALDRFTVPPMSAGLVNRTVAAMMVAPPPRVAPRHDRRRLWRRGRQVIIGTVAAGMLSAAAVASGLLDHTGIEVPVLTAMLSPAHRHAAKLHHDHKTALVAREHKVMPAPPTPVAVPVHVVPLPVAVAPGSAQPTAEQLMQRELAMERRDARIVFAQTHPRAAAAIAWHQRIARGARLRGQPLTPAALDPALQDFQSPEFRAERAMTAQARRERRAALGLPVRPIGKPGLTDARSTQLPQANSPVRAAEPMATLPAAAPARPSSSPASGSQQQEHGAEIERVAAGHHTLRQKIDNELRAERQMHRRQNLAMRLLRFRP